MRKLLLIPFSAALLLTPLVAACASPEQAVEKTGQYIDDAAISTKVRASIATELKMYIIDVNVETHAGIVQLSGFVDQPDVKRRAGEVAAGVEGVKRVVNDLVVTVKK